MPLRDCEPSASWSMPLTSSSMMLPSCVNSRPTNAARCAAPCDRCSDTKPHGLAVLAQACGIPSHICRLTAFCIDKPAYLAGRRDLGRIWNSALVRIAEPAPRFGNADWHPNLTSDNTMRPATTLMPLADGKPFPHDEHDFCCRSSRHPGKEELKRLNRFKPCIRRIALRSDAGQAQRLRPGDNWRIQSWFAWA